VLERGLAIPIIIAREIQFFLYDHVLEMRRHNDCHQLKVAFILISFRLHQQKKFIHYISFYIGLLHSDTTYFPQPLMYTVSYTTLLPVVCIQTQNTHTVYQLIKHANLSIWSPSVARSDPLFKWAKQKNVITAGDGFRFLLLAYTTLSALNIVYCITLFFHSFSHIPDMFNPAALPSNKGIFYRFFVRRFYKC
jgi:hypothetical protein